ncbi:MAG: hypothetical protein SNI51_00865 [Rikenellaceae bacterium]
MKTKLFLISLFALLAISTAEAQPPKSGSSGLKATQNGIGVLTFGSNVSDLPATADGMYDRIEKEYDDFEGSTIFRLYLGKKLQYILITNNQITNIEVYDSNVDLGGFKVGDSISKIMALKPKQEITNEGLQVSINGCFLGIHGSLNESGMKKYNGAYANLEKGTLNVSDFKDGATLQYALIYKD